MLIQADRLFRLFSEADEELYLVGGYVRDRLMGRESCDLDLATSAIPAKTTAILEADGLKAIPIGIEFGTVGTILPGEGGPVEAQITTFRCRESYRKGSRHPEVSFGSTLGEDLLRRDFTINAMAIGPSGDVIDPLDGLSDLDAGLIRTPLDPFVTFGEDPLRMLRAFRFGATLGFTIDPVALEAAGELHSLILDVSRERWKMEMDGMLSAPDGTALVRSLEQMRTSGLLTELLPELKPMFEMRGLPQGAAHTADIWGHTLDVVRLLPLSDPVTRWAALLHDAGKPEARTVDAGGEPHFRTHETSGGEIADGVCERFRFSKKDRTRVRLLVRNHMRPVLYSSSEWTDRAVRKLINDSGDCLDRLLALAEADILAHTESYSEAGLRNLDHLRERVEGLKIRGTGERLIPGGLGAILSEKGGGPETGVILANLEELILEGSLPAMAPPDVYLEYIGDHPEVRERKP